MTVHTHRKGRRTEASAVRILRRHGYATHRTHRSGAKAAGGWVSNAHDVFGAVDIIAKKAGERTRWIQVTAGRDVGRKARELLEIPWTPEHDKVEIWRWIGGRGVDGRTGRPRKAQYFQVYLLDEDFALLRDDAHTVEGNKGDNDPDGAGVAQ